MFAVAVVLVTWSTQYRILRDQDAELVQQRKIQEDRADLELRKMHVDLIRMALNDNRLAEVWPRIAGVDPVTESQHMYANLLLQHIWLEYSAGRSSRDQTTRPGGSYEAVVRRERRAFQPDHPTAPSNRVHIRALTAASMTSLGITTMLS